MVDKTNGGFYISRIKQLSGRRFEKLLKENGIDDFNGAQGRILFVLWQEDNVPISEISRQTSLAKTTLTSMLDRMEKSGHINRTFDANNRRQVLITLTEKTRGLKKSYETVSAQMNELFYKNFSNDEIIQFEKQMERIIQNLEENEG